MRDLADLAISNSLASSNANARYLKIADPARVILKIKDSNIVVVKPIPARTRKSTIQALLNSLDLCLTSATREYNAHHDELTTVLNRHGIRSSLAEIFSQSSTINFSANSEKQISDQGSLVLFAFDIDRFKNVNDTHGHAAGDKVLFKFANRIASLVDDFASHYSAKFVFGRPGGEEFELLAVGALSKADRAAIGAALLAGIRAPETAVKAEVLLNRPGLGAVTRAGDVVVNVTASIGVAWQKIGDDASPDALHDKLRKEADAAVYRAKADGRDCLRVYEDIRHLHGRISKYYADSDLVQIDVGSSVGVKVGEVYAVYSPPFTGEKNIHENGSSSKILGRFPKVEAARICVIDVQNEVGICVVLERSTASALAEGALLRYIHRGSMRLPFRRHSNLSAAVDDHWSLEEYLKTLGGDDGIGALILVSGRLNSEDPRPRIDKLNELIMMCYVALPTKSRVFHTLGGGTYIVVPRQTDADTDWEELLSRIGTIGDQSGHKLIMGICIPSDLPINTDRSPRALVFYCHAALAIAKSAKKFAFFRGSTPNALLHKWRGRGLTEDAIADYQQLKIFGFSSDLLDNQLALIIFENDEVEHFALAEVAINNACTSAPEDDIFAGNLALLRARRGDYAAAYETFEKIRGTVAAEGGGYLIGYARSALEVYRLGLDVNKKDVGDLLLEAVTSCESMSLRPQYSRLLEEVREALKSGEFD